MKWVTTIRWWIVVAGVVGVGACDCSGGTAQISGASEIPTAGDPTSQAAGLEALGPAPGDVPNLGAVYREAYEEAAEQITSENAEERLRVLEKKILSEREELR